MSSQEEQRDRDNGRDPGTETVEPIEQVQRVRCSEHEERDDEDIQNILRLCRQGQTQGLGNLLQVGIDTDQQEKARRQHLAEHLVTRPQVQEIVHQAHETSNR